MKNGCRNRRYARAIALAYPVYGKGRKADVPAENPFASRNNMLRKVMLFAAISWYDTTKPFFE